MKIKGIRVVMGIGSLYGDESDPSDGKFLYEIVDNLHKPGDVMPLITQLKGYDHFKFVSKQHFTQRSITTTDQDSVRSALREYMHSHRFPDDYRLSTSIFGQALLSYNHSRIVPNPPTSVAGVVELLVVYTPFLERMLERMDTASDADIREALKTLLAQNAISGLGYLGVMDGNTDHKPDIFAPEAASIIANYQDLTPLVDSTHMTYKFMCCLGEFLEESFPSRDLNLISRHIERESLLAFCDALAAHANSDLKCRFRVEMDTESPYHFSVRFRGEDSYHLRLEQFSFEDVSAVAYRHGLWPLPVSEEITEPDLVQAMVDSMPRPIPSDHSIPRIVRRAEVVQPEDDAVEADETDDDWESNDWEDEIEND